MYSSDSKLGPSAGLPRIKELFLDPLSCIQHTKLLVRTVEDINNVFSYLHAW